MLLQRAEVHPVEVIVAHKSHLRAVGAEGRQALFPVVAQLREGLFLDVVQVVVAHPAVAVDGLEPAAEQYLLLVLAELIPFESHSGTVKQTHIRHLLAGLVAILRYACPRHGAVVLAVLHRPYPVYALCAECTLRPDVFQCDILFPNLSGSARGYGRKCHNHKQFLHIVVSL